MDSPFQPISVRQAPTGTYEHQKRWGHPYFDLVPSEPLQPKEYVSVFLYLRI